MRHLLLLAALAPVGCSPTAPTTAAEPPAERKPVEQKPADPPADPDKPAPLPDPPKADPKSTHKKLLPDGQLILERKPDGTARVLVAAEVCQRNVPLEVFVCKARTKEHEAILRVDFDAQFIHAALVAAGAKVGKPVQFVNPTTQEEEYKPASGAKIAVSVHYVLNGKPVTRPAQDWVQDIRTEKPMAHDWVFAGSRFMKIPDRPAEPEYYCANNGEVIGISNFPDSMLDIPVEVSRDNESLAFRAWTDRIPAIKSKVWVILEAAAEKKDKK